MDVNGLVGPDCSLGGEGPGWGFLTNSDPGFSLSFPGHDA